MIFTSLTTLYVTLIPVFTNTLKKEQLQVTVLPERETGPADACLMSHKPLSPADLGHDLRGAA